MYRYRYRAIQGTTTSFRGVEHNLYSSGPGALAVEVWSDLATSMRWQFRTSEQGILGCRSEGKAIHGMA